MPRPCSICTHPQRAAIDKALVAGEPFRNIAAGSGLSVGSLHRHKTEHLEAPVAEPERNGVSKPAELRLPSPPPVRHGESKTSPRVVETSELEARCVELRVAGKTYVQIAAELGVSDSAAFDAVDRVLMRTRGRADETAELARKIEIERCEKLIASLWDRATDPSMAVVDVPADTESGVRAYDGQDKAADRLLKAMERLAKLRGLDAPITILNVLEDPKVRVIWAAVRGVLERPEHAAAKAAVNEELAAMRARPVKELGR